MLIHSYQKLLCSPCLGIKTGCIVLLFAFPRIPPRVHKDPQCCCSNKTSKRTPPFNTYVRELSFPHHNMVVVVNFIPKRGMFPMQGGYRRPSNHREGVPTQRKILFRRSRAPCFKTKTTQKKQAPCSDRDHPGDAGILLSGHLVSLKHKSVHLKSPQGFFRKTDNYSTKPIQGIIISIP